MGVNFRCYTRVGRLSLEVAGGEYTGFIGWMVHMNFLHYALLLFAICSIILVGVSLLRPDAESYDDETLVWSAENAVPMTSTTKALTFLLVLCVVTLWVVL